MGLNSSHNQRKENFLSFYSKISWMEVALKNENFRKCKGLTTDTAVNTFLPKHVSSGSISGFITTSLSLGKRSGHHAAIKLRMV